MLVIKDENIGGAIVRRTFSDGTKHWKAGEMMTRDQVLAIRRPNRNSLSENHNIDIYPLAPSAEPGERFMMGVGKDVYNVVEGRLLNAKPLGRKEAEALVNG